MVAQPFLHVCKEYLLQYSPNCFLDWPHGDVSLCGTWVLLHVFSVRFPYFPSAYLMLKPYSLFEGLCLGPCTQRVPTQSRYSFSSVSPSCLLGANPIYM